MDSNPGALGHDSNGQQKRAAVRAGAVLTIIMATSRLVLARGGVVGPAKDSYLVTCGVGEVAAGAREVGVVCVEGQCPGGLATWARLSCG